MLTSHGKHGRAKRVAGPARNGRRLLPFKDMRGARGSFENLEIWDLLVYLGFQKVQDVFPTQHILFYMKEE